MFQGFIFNWPFDKMVLGVSPSLTKVPELMGDGHELFVL